MRQGDPLGPLLFAVAAHFILEEAAAQGLDSRAYLDDGIFTTPEPFTVATSLPRMKEFYSRVRPTARKYGMDLQFAKCKGLWLSGATVPKELAEWTDEIGLRIETRASVLLGSPVGRDPAAIEACV